MVPVLSEPLWVARYPNEINVEAHRPVDSKQLPGLSALEMHRLRGDTRAVAAYSQPPEEGSKPSGFVVTSSIPA